MTNVPVQQAHTDIFLKSFDSASLIKGAKVIDIGCGDGYASTRFILGGCSVLHALDPQSENLSTQGIPASLEGMQKDSYRFFKSWGDLDIPEGGYDIVWHHHVVEHIEDCFGFLTKCHGLLAPTGQMWLACPNMAQHSVYSPGHIHNFQAAQMVEVLRRCCFAVGDISIWVLKGQLRIRVPKQGNYNYPTVMQQSLEKTGRCPSDLLTKVNW